MLAKNLFLLAATFAICSAQSEQTVQNVLDKVSLPPELQGKLTLPAELQGKLTLPPELQGKLTLPPELQGSAKDVEEMQTKALNEFKTRCEKNGGPDAYLKAQNGTQDLYKCVNQLVNLTSLQQEVEEAKPHGNVDEVFKKYCDKKPQFVSCVQEFRNSSSSCLSEEEQGHLKMGYNVSLQLAEFICFKDGDRIALFIAEGGQECFQNKNEALRECVNKTMGFKGDFDINSLSEATITFDEKQCSQMSELQKCVVDVLLACPTPTSANIVESLFKFIRKTTPCKNYDKDEDTTARSKKAETQKGGATTFYVATATLVTAFLAAVLV